MALEPEILCIIPARGGSKSIPRKNIKLLAGKPLIHYSILDSLESKWISRTIVSTDDGEIAQIAKDCGAEIPFIRPKNLAQDDSTDFDVFYHALYWLQEKENYSPELVVQLRPTVPIRSTDTIDKAIEKILVQPEADSLRSVTLALQTPFKMWFLSKDYMEPVLRKSGIEESYNQPRQKLPNVYWQNGYIDITRPRTVLDKGQMCGKNILPFVLPNSPFEIDYPEDWLEVEKILLKEATPMHQPEARHPV